MVSHLFVSHAALRNESCGLGASFDVELRVDARHVVADGAFGKGEISGDLSVRESTPEQGEDLGLAEDIVGRLTLGEGSYLRVEAQAQRGDATTHAYTNPIWVDGG